MNLVMILIWETMIENEAPCVDRRYELDVAVVACAEKIDTMIYLPNIIDLDSPSENRIIVQSNIEDLAVESFYVFDRWGEMIFALEDALANDPSLGWDGTFNGIKVEQGVYVYMIKVEGSQPLIVDDLTIIRQ